MKWYYTVLIVLVIIIVAVLVVGIVINKLIFDGSFGKLIRTLVDAKKGNFDSGITEGNVADLSDNDLNLSVLLNIQNKYSDSLSNGNLYNTLNEKEKTFYVVMLYEIEFQNGGLCQYFVNSSRGHGKLSIR